LKAYQKLDQFREEAKFASWLIRIVLNEALMKVRKQRTFREESIDSNFQSETDALPRDLADWSPNPQEIYGDVELREILIKCLVSLRPALRVVFVLRDIEELSVSETCEALNLSQAVVKSRLFRARLRLRERLTRYFRNRHGQPSAIDLTSQITDWKDSGALVGNG
jgi:RNA polymerase sigma-70 factor (ECF subfamily)